MMPTSQYVETRNGGYYVAGSRIGLDIVTYAFRRGRTAEDIFRSYPSIGSLAKVYGAIAFYLGSRKEVEADIAEREGEEDAFTAAHPTPPEVRMTFERMQQSALRRS